MTSAIPGKSFRPGFILLGAVLAFPAAAQSRAAVDGERTAFAEWLGSSPVSPWRALVVRSIGGGLSLGPDSADIPLAGVAAARLTERNGRVLLRTGANELGLSRDRIQTVEGWRLIVSGPPGRTTVTVFGAAPAREHKKLSYFDYSPAGIHLVTLRPANTPRAQRLMTQDGIEIEATEAGTVEVSLSSSRRSLSVMRLPGATEDESELEIYFRDATSGKTTYPAGRFVSLIPRPDGKYILDFNRARNPFCAYNTVYPCPSPWRGNSLAEAIRAGERYSGGGLEVRVP